MDKVKIITDTASDVPDEELRRYHIDMLSVPVTVDGKGFFERKSFSIKEFYRVLAASKEIPVTSRIPAIEYAEAYKRAWQEGYTHIIVVTINAGGSGIYQSALMGIDMLREESPEAADALEIYVQDSQSYSMGYGLAVIECGRMAKEGESFAKIKDYLQDYVACNEVYLATYTLEYAKKSGRIGAAAAFVGDVLGLRPIIAMIGGGTKVIDKVRGEKQVVQRLFAAYKANCTDYSAPCVIIKGEVDEYGEELAALFKKELGKDVPIYNAGASIVINAGPKIAAVILHGKKRA